MSEAITVWFLLLSYSQLWPGHRDGIPQHNIDTVGVYFSRAACERAASHASVRAYEKSAAGPIAHNYDITKRCVKSEAESPLP